MIKDGFVDWVKLCVNAYRANQIKMYRDDIQHFMLQDKPDQVERIEKLLRNFETMDDEELLPQMIGLAHQMSVTQLKMREMYRGGDVKWMRNTV